MTKPAPARGFIAQQARRIEQLLGENKMLRAQNFELSRLLREARQGCADCPEPELLKASIATSVMGPLLRAEIRTAIAEKENHEGCQAQSLPDCSTSR